MMEPGESLQPALLKQLVAPRGVLESQSGGDGREMGRCLAGPPHVSGEGGIGR